MRRTSAPQPQPHPFRSLLKPPSTTTIISTHNLSSTMVKGSDVLLIIVRVVVNVHVVAEMAVSYWQWALTTTRLLSSFPQRRQRLSPAAAVTSSLTSL